MNEERGATTLHTAHSLLEAVHRAGGRAAGTLTALLEDATFESDEEGQLRNARDGMLKSSRHALCLKQIIALAAAPPRMRRCEIDLVPLVGDWVDVIAQTRRTAKVRFVCEVSRLVVLHDPQIVEDVVHAVLAAFPQLPWPIEVSLYEGLYGPELSASFERASGETVAGDVFSRVEDPLRTAPLDDEAAELSVLELARARMLLKATNGALELEEASFGLRCTARLCARS